MSHLPSRPTRPAWGRAALAGTAAALLNACAVPIPVPAPPPPLEAPEPAPQASACPAGVPADARCWRGRDSQGAHVLMAMPARWSGVLVVHAHGGPVLGEPRASRADEDLQRWVITLKAGHAWVGSVFRQGGVAVTSAAEDTERARRLFVQHIAQPRVTLLHGQSWGAGVAAKLAEQMAAPGQASPYAGMLLTSGVLAGGHRNYDFRLDLRVVYQYLCGNHPRPDEPAYPLWMGLPADSRLTRADLDRRLDDCLGLRQPAAQRTPEQARRLRTLVSVVRIPEASVRGHLAWATWHFQDIALQRTGGLNIFGNEGVRYQGSDDDAALNAGVLRYRADPAGVARFEADAGLSGRIGIPVLAAHAVGDPTAFVELQSAFRDTLAQAGQAGRLVQVYSDHAEHSYLSDATYLALFDQLLRWTAGGPPPTPAGVVARCRELDAGGSGCRLLPDYRPAPLSSRVAPRG